MSPPESNYGTYDRRLLAALIPYGLVNVLGLVLAARQIIDPPWEVMIGFSFVGPAIGILFACAARVFGGGRLFTWPAVVGFAIAMLLAAYLNTRVLIGAADSV